MNNYDSHDFGTYRASDQLVKMMNEEMQRDGYEMDSAAMQAIAALIDDCGTAINFLDALAQGARAAAEWAETEMA
ncbi:hypothetical protein ACUY29_11395 [Corynebacterium aurimucosum]